jgi:hypothetical protein
LLGDDPAAQDFYIKYMSVHAQLHLDYSSGATPVAMPGGSSMPLTAPADAVPESDTIGSDDLGVLLRSAQGPGSHRTLRWPLAMAFGGGLAAALLVFGLMALFGFRQRRPAPAAVPAPTSSGAVVQAPPQRIAPAPGFAVVVKVDGVQWEEDGHRNPSEGDILAGERLRLRSGKLILGFLSGVILTLEGPADLELIAIDRVFCHLGKIRTRVPAGAEGFVVSAPGSDVTDLGTEIGLNVEAGGKAQVMVFEGEASAAVLDASGSAQRSRHLTERSALEIDPLRFDFNAAEPRSESFVATPALAIASLPLAASYRATVLESRPWGYWRFEAIDGGVVINEIAGRPALRATGPIQLAGGANRSAVFGPDDVDQYLMMDGRWAPPRNSGYAVELWFAPERISLAALAGLFVSRGGEAYEHTFLLELTARNQESFLFRRASIRFLHRWPPGFEGGDNLFSDYYVPYRWHHVVAQTKADRMELYVDGSPLPTLSISSDRATEACEFLVGRLKPLSGPNHPREIRSFVGQIDEVALYDRALSVDEIGRHYRLGVPGHRSTQP